jgi:hypothetical protein
MVNKNFTSLYRRLSLRFRKPPLAEGDQYFNVLKEVDPLWRLTGAPQKPNAWKLLTLFFILFLALGIVWLAR